MVGFWLWGEGRGWCWGNGGDPCHLCETLEGSSGYPLEIINFSVQCSYGDTVGRGGQGRGDLAGQPAGEVIQVCSDGADLCGDGICEEGGGVQDWPDGLVFLYVEAVIDSHQEVVFEGFIWGFFQVLEKEDCTLYRILERVDDRLLDITNVGLRGRGVGKRHWRRWWLK